ncbi:MAG TPA: response regulator [Candidatus Sulfopaludibacter sp.]|nr:response regulator [Candidatus Sulfopaludibacter sp.]
MMTRVLVVDDDYAIRDLVARMLTVLGCWAVTAGNGLDAVDRFLAEPGRFHLVVTDLNMPVMDGHEAVRRIQKAQPCLPIVCMSGSDTARCPAGTRFLSKPFTLAELQECVHLALKIPPELFAA